jgi:hypothetical protein
MGEALFGIGMVEEAAVEEFVRHYKRQCNAARAIAEDYFGARKVTWRLLTDLGFA